MKSQQKWILFFHSALFIKKLEVGCEEKGAPRIFSLHLHKHIPGGERGVGKFMMLQQFLPMFGAPPFLHQKILSHWCLRHLHCQNQIDLLALTQDCSLRQTYAYKVTHPAHCHGFHPVFWCRPLHRSSARWAVACQSAEGDEVSCLTVSKQVAAYGAPVLPGYISQGWPPPPSAPAWSPHWRCCSTSAALL